MKTTDTQRINWLVDNVAYIKTEAEDDTSLPYYVCYAPGGPNGIYAEIGRGDEWRECCDDAMKLRPIVDAIVGILTPFPKPRQAQLLRAGALVSGVEAY